MLRPSGLDVDRPQTSLKHIRDRGRQVVNVGVRWNDASPRRRSRRYRSRPAPREYPLCRCVHRRAWALPELSAKITSRGSGMFDLAGEGRIDAYVSEALLRAREGFHVAAAIFGDIDTATGIASAELDRIADVETDVERGDDLSFLKRRNRDSEAHRYCVGLSPILEKTRRQACTSGSSPSELVASRPSAIVCEPGRVMTDQRILRDARGQENGGRQLGVVTPDFMRMAGSAKMPSDGTI